MWKSEGCAKPSESFTDSDSWLCLSLDIATEELVLFLRKDCLTPHCVHTTQLGSMLELTLLSRLRRAHAEGMRRIDPAPSSAM